MENPVSVLLVVAGLLVFIGLLIAISRQQSRLRWQYQENPEIQRQIEKTNAEIQTAIKRHRPRSLLYQQVKRLRNMALERELRNG